MTLRGICPNMFVDTNYVLSLHMYHDGFLKFIGSSIYEIRFSKEGQAWQLVDISTEVVIANMETNLGDTSDYPIGTYTWIFANETCTDKSDAQGKMMNFYSCSRDEFPCENGECIEMAKRCNRREDCKDQSDEKNCNIVELSEGYNRELPPSEKNSSILLDVYVYASIFEIANIDENAGTLHIGLVLDTYWFDDRVTYNFLKDHENLNNIPRIATSTTKKEFKVWTPNFNFHSTEGALTTNRIPSDESSTLRVQRQGSPFVNNVHELAFYQQFEGHENVLHKNSYYSFSFICDFHFGNFPFDQQVCRLMIVADIPVREFINVLPGNKFVSYSGAKKVGGFLIGNITLKKENFWLNLDIPYQRNLFGIVMSTYLPTILLNMLSQSTNYFGDTNDVFDAVIAANLTIMMVLTSLHISVYNSLPSSDFLKYIDIWMIFNLLFTFVTALLQVYIHNQSADVEEGLSKVSPINKRAKGRRLSPEKKVKAAKFVGKFVNPAIGILFVIIYWAYGLLFLRV